jgi:hypothetical protein
VWARKYGEVVISRKGNVIFYSQALLRLGSAIITDGLDAVPIQIKDI